MLIMVSHVDIAAELVLRVIVVDIPVLSVDPLIKSTKHPMMNLAEKVQSAGCQS